tara:strand:- start:2319 stop:2711 length:393 start_codon:yes stop_codon:yes gene_type:complete
MTEGNAIEYLKSTIVNIENMMDKEEACHLQSQADVMTKYEKTIANKEAIIRSIDEKVKDTKRKYKDELEAELQLIETEYIYPKLDIKTLRKQQRQEINSKEKEYQTIKKDHYSIILDMERQRLSHFSTDN